MYLCVSLYVLKYFSACLGTKDALIAIIYRVPGYICLCTYPSVSSSFLPLCMSLWSTTSHCFCYFLPLCVCVFMCVCDELAGNWLLNGATAAMWDKIETRGTERPIHLLSANQPCKTTGPFIKPPLTTCRDTHTHTHRVMFFILLEDWTTNLHFNLHKIITS